MGNLISQKFNLIHMPAIQEDYDLLGLEPGVDRSQLKQAFRDLARVYHSDRYSGDDADERFREVHAAYRRLLASLDSGGNPVASGTGVEGADAASYYSEAPEAYAPPLDIQDTIHISVVHRDAFDLSVLGEFNVDAYISAFNESTQRSLLSNKPEERMNMFFFMMLPTFVFDCSYTEVQQYRGQNRYRHKMRRIYFNALNAGLFCSDGADALGHCSVAEFAPHYPHVGDERFEIQLPYTKAQPNSHGLTVILESTVQQGDALHYMRSHMAGYQTLEPSGYHYLPIGFCRFQDDKGYYRDMLYHPQATPEMIGNMCPLDQDYMEYIIGEFFAK
jgi:hypothetical protein